MRGFPAFPRDVVWRAIVSSTQWRTGVSGSGGGATGLQPFCQIAWFSGVQFWPGNVCWLPFSSM